MVRRCPGELTQFSTAVLGSPLSGGAGKYREVAVKSIGIAMGEGQLTLLLAVMPGVPAGGVILRRVHQRRVSRNCGQAMLLPNLVDQGEDVLTDLQILVQISGGRVSQGTVLSDRNRKNPPAGRWAQ